MYSRYTYRCAYVQIAYVSHIVPGGCTLVANVPGSVLASLLHGKDVVKSRS